MEESDAILAADPAGCRHYVRSAWEDGNVVVEVGLVVGLADGRRARETWRVTLTTSAGSESLQFEGASGEDGAGLQLLSTAQETTPDRLSRCLLMRVLPPHPGDYAVDSVWQGGAARLGFELDDSGRVMPAGGH